MSQIALPLSAPAGGGPAAIVLGNANRAVADALLEPAAWPFSTAVLTGPPRSGKSLFARWFGQTQRDADVLDDADALPEETVFHRWNRAREEGRSLLLVAARRPWEIALPDLRSRLAAALQLEIGTPDDALIAELIASHARQRLLALGEQAPGYLSGRVERSFAAIEALVAAIDRLSLERKAPPGPAIWREALERSRGGEWTGPGQASLF